MLGWFGGYGYSATMGFFTGMMHIPAPLAFLAIVAEFFGGLGLILGLLTRIAAFGIGMNMIVAIVTVHSAFGFFMNWSGAQKGEGFEYHLLVLAMVVFLMIRVQAPSRLIVPLSLWQPHLRDSQIWHIHERSSSDSECWTSLFQRKESAMNIVRSVPNRVRAVAELAYHLWEERGCPEGSPEDDWYKAELMIDQRTTSSEEENKIA